MRIPIFITLNEYRETEAAGSKKWFARKGLQHRDPFVNVIVGTSRMNSNIDKIP